jgi:tRNA nucleotidyltransferase (CCA-adding enzyme)
MDALIEAAPVRAPGVWIVGGAVRDHLLGIEPRELDLVVEGDALALARQIGELVAVHERFGTATVMVDGRIVDLAGARTERYPRPGALPEVLLNATIDEDLRRRDFTINAMAVHTADGAEVSVEGAREDLAAGVLRVLHPLSFQDDPTRMLRLARYASRLGLAVSPETGALIDPMLLADVSGHRIGSELLLGLQEEHPELFLNALDRLGLATAVIHPAFEANIDDVEELSAAALALPDLRADIAALAACCIDVPLEALRLQADDLGLDATEREILLACVERQAEIGLALDRRPGRADLYRLLRRERPEVVLLAGVRGSITEAMEWLIDVRHVRSEVSGDALVAAGLSGPAVGEALERATIAAIEGRGPDEQLAAALGAP